MKKTKILIGFIIFILIILFNTKVKAFDASAWTDKIEEEIDSWEDKLFIVIQQGDFIYKSAEIHIDKKGNYHTGKETREITFSSDYVYAEHSDGSTTLKRGLKDENGIEKPIYIYFFYSDDDLYDNKNHEFSVGGAVEGVTYSGPTFRPGGWYADVLYGYAKASSLGSGESITMKISADEAGGNLDLKLLIKVEVESKTKQMEKTLLKDNPNSDSILISSGSSTSMQTKIQTATLNSQKYKWPGRYEEVESHVKYYIYEQDNEFSVTETAYLVYSGQGDEEKIYLHSCSYWKNNKENEYVFLVAREDKTEEYKGVPRDENGNLIIDEEVQNDIDESMENANKIIYDAYEATVLSSYASGYRASAPFKDVLEFIGDYKPDDMDPDTSGKVEEISSKVLSVVTNIGMVVTILIIALLGIKYMLGSVEEKAEYKKDLVPVLIGALLLFGVVAFVKIFMAIGEQISVL